MADHYEVLGIPRNAPQPDVRKAYLKKVREFPPEKNQDEFARISSAYAILGNAEKRAEYDREGELPEAIQKEVDRAFEMLEANSKAALKILRRLRAKHPEFELLRHLLATALFVSEQYADSANELSELVRIRPDHGQYQYDLAQALSQVSGREQDAISMLKRLLLFEKTNTPAYLLLARLMWNQGDRNAAHAILDRGIEADGSADFKDLPLYIRKLVYFTIEYNSQGVERTLNAIERVVLPLDIDARGLAAGQLSDLGNELIENNRQVVATKVFVTAAKLNPEKTDLREFAEKRRSLSNESTEYSDFSSSEEPDWLLQYVACLVDSDLAKKHGDHTIKNFRFMIANSLIVTPSRRDEVIASARRFPKLFDIIRESLNDDIRIAGEASGLTSSYKLLPGCQRWQANNIAPSAAGPYTTTSYPQSQSNSEASGCVILFVCLIVTVAAATTAVVF